MSTFDNPDEMDLRCAEYALGVLGDDERREVERAMRQDPQMAQAVARWQARLMPLSEDIEEVAPPQDVWNRVQSQVGLTAHARGRESFWDSLRFWRWTALGSAIAAGGLAVVLIGSVLLRHAATPPAAPQYLIATLKREGSSSGWTATVDAQHARIVVVPPRDLAIGSTQSTQMWMIPPGSKPLSLGVIDASRPTVVHVPPERLDALRAKVTLAVSLEPRGGSPTGQPTGPVLAAGPVEGI